LVNAVEHTFEVTISVRIQEPKHATTVRSHIAVASAIVPQLSISAARISIDFEDKADGEAHEAGDVWSN
jgi:hypothetical protein